jgi:hypothetical protein
MLRFLRWPMMAVFGLTLSACATVNVSSHVARGLDFANYNSWQWAPPDALPATDARLDNAFFRDHFQGAVERELARRGLALTPGGGQPDLLVHYHANVATRIAVNNGDPTIGACYDADCNVRVLDNELGTIVLDVVDAKTNRLIWRGWAQTSVDGVLDRPERLDARIRKAVRGMFARFPRAI